MYFSISTSTCAPVHPRASDDVPVSDVSTLGLPCTHIASGSPASSGSYQAPVDSCTTPRPQPVVDGDARQAGAAVVEDAHDVAGHQPALGGVRGLHADRLAVLDFRALAGGAAVELAVQAGGGLVGEQVQRDSGRRARTAEPLGGFEPRRMARAVGIAEPVDVGREDLDAAAWRGERGGHRVGAEVGEQRQPGLGWQP